MHPDLKLKDLFETLIRKDAASKEAEDPAAETFFELEVARLTDEFQGRCMALLSAVLEIGDYKSIVRYFELIEASVSSEFVTRVYTDLFKMLIKDVLFRADPAIKKLIIEQLKLFGESTEK